MKENQSYQSNLSIQSPILLDEKYKQPKVDKMLAVLHNCGVLAEPDGVAVDVGCSAGYFTRALSPFFRCVYGVDIDDHAFSVAKEKSCGENIAFILADSLKLPFEDKSVDIVICNHVYEHVPEPMKLFREIERVLTPEGLCYLGAASRFIIQEPHYHLPFLSWLPKSLAHSYMRISGRGSMYYETLRTYWGIKKMISHFDVEDYTLKIVRDPERFRARDMIPENSWVEKVPFFFWKMLYVFFPSYILILRRK